MISKDKQYRTLDGKEVRIYATDGAGQHPIHGAVLSYGAWIITKWTKQGTYHVGTPSDLDLIEKPRIQRRVWLNVYPENGLIISWHTRRGLADRSACADRIACIPIDIDCEEGEGL
jgi:hypothetical protein